MTRPAWRRVLQVLLVVAALVVIGELVRREWPRLRVIDVQLDPALLGAATAAWLAAFAVLTRAWARSLGWWGRTLGTLDALRIFFLSNLARYIPGAIWQFTSLATLTSGAGVSAVSATAAVLLQQVIVLGTGLVLSVVLAPRFLGVGAGTGVGDATASLPPVWRVLAAIGALIVFTAVLPRLMPVLRRVLRRMAHRDLIVPRMPRGAFAGYVAQTAVALLLYGASFWLLGLATLAARAPGPWLAASAFIAAYMVGILAVFAPGGIGFREGALAAALAPSIGLDNALFLAVASRLWQIGIEVIGALLALAIPGRLLSGRAAPARAGSAREESTSAAAPADGAARGADAGS